MANIFLKIEGIDGSSKVEGYDKHIDIYNFGFGVSQSGALESLVAGKSIGSSQVHTLNFSKPFDLSSANLALYCAKATHMPKVELKVGLTVEGKMEDYQIYTLEECMLCDWSIGASADQEPQESFTLAYTKIAWLTKFPDAKGQLQNGPEFKWDQSTHNIF